MGGSKERNLSKKKEPVTISQSKSPQPTPALPEFKAPARNQIWTYGVNAALDSKDISADVLKAFKPAGSLRQDFRALCQRWGAVPHSSLVRAHESVDEVANGTSPAEEAQEAPTLSLQSVMFDVASIRVLSAVLPTCQHLEVIRFSGCQLTAEMLSLLRAGLTDVSTVITLHIDWNPVELSLDSSRVHALPDPGTVEDADELQHQIALSQSGRTLRSFGERLEAVAGESVTKSVEMVATHLRSQFPVTALPEPLCQATWETGFRETFGFSAEDVGEIFRVLDAPPFGRSCELVPLSRIDECLSQLQQPTVEEEAEDPVGAAFASFVDASSVTELVSFRQCKLGRLEAQSIGKALKGCQHLRALNLWGNRITDRAAAGLAVGLEENSSLLYLGLGRNLVTHAGLESLCRPLNSERLNAKDRVDQATKSIKEHAKAIEKKFKGAIPKRDGKGRERYHPRPQTDCCEGCIDPITEEKYWLLIRTSAALRTLVLEHNPISDAAAVLRLLPFGNGGDLLLRGCPCVPDVIEGLAAQAQEKEEAEQRAREARAVATAAAAAAEADHAAKLLTAKPKAGAKVSKFPSPGGSKSPAPGEEPREEHISPPPAADGQAGDAKTAAGWNLVFQ